MRLQITPPWITRRLRTTVWGPLGGRLTGCGLRTSWRASLFGFGALEPTGRSRTSKAGRRPRVQLGRVPRRWPARRPGLPAAPLSKGDSPPGAPHNVSLGRAHGPLHSPGRRGRRVSAAALRAPDPPANSRGRSVHVTRASQWKLEAARDAADSS